MHKLNTYPLVHLTLYHMIISKYIKNQTEETTHSKILRSHAENVEDDRIEALHMGQRLMPATVKRILTSL